MATPIMTEAEPEVETEAEPEAPRVSPLTFEELEMYMEKHIRN